MVYIKYSGTIAGKDAIQQLVEEFVDICRISGWDYEVVKENFQSMTSRPNLPDAGQFMPGEGDEAEEIQTLSSSEVYLEGIIIKPAPDRDPIKLTFDKGGRLATIAFSATDSPGFTKKITVKKYEFLYFPFVKVFTRDFDHHTQVIKILDYVKKRYIRDLEVIDTSFYWETRDDEQLRVKLWRVLKNKDLII
jgi:hypothetical protein